MLPQTDSLSLRAFKVFAVQYFENVALRKKYFYKYLRLSKRKSKRKKKAKQINKQRKKNQCSNFLLRLDTIKCRKSTLVEDISSGPITAQWLSKG